MDGIKKNLKFTGFYLTLLLTGILVGSILFSIAHVLIIQMGGML